MALLELYPEDSDLILTLMGDYSEPSEANSAHRISEEVSKSSDSPELLILNKDKLSPSHSKDNTQS